MKVITTVPATKLTVNYTEYCRTVGSHIHCWFYLLIVSEEIIVTHGVKEALSYCHILNDRSVAKTNGALRNLPLPPPLQVSLH